MQVCQGNYPEATRTVIEALYVIEQEENTRALVHALTTTTELMKLQQNWEATAQCIALHDTLREREDLPLSPQVAPSYEMIRQETQQKLGRQTYSQQFQDAAQLPKGDIIPHLLALLAPWEDR